MFWRLRDPEHPAYDAALAAKYGDSVEKSYRTMDEIVGETAKALTGDLGVIPRHFSPGVIAYSAGIPGPNVKASDAELSWNIYEWTAN